mmetsp:Transcript_713/g.1514  ORF Transcript_713/g.1514 Transcript_713/m.1514 type:complete len:161 (-) Transcript_713:125-607(-)
MHHEPLLMAQAGARVTVIDTDIDNLKVLHRLQNASGVDGRHLNLVHLASADAILTLGREFDAVLILDSLTRGPVELVAAEYRHLAKCLKAGGRWLQLAPSKIWYQRRSEKSLGSLEVWHDWLDLAKLLRLLQPSRFHVIFDAKLEDDTWQWFDLLRLDDS